MSLTDRDKRALVLLGVAVALMLAVRVWLDRSEAAPTVAPASSIQTAEERLAHVRRLARQAPVRQKQIEALTAEVAGWEKGLIAADTVQQAQAQMLQILRRLASAQEPKLEFRSEEIGPVRPPGKERHYGEALVTVSFVAGIEQLVNLLADLAAQPEALGTEEIFISGANPKDKTLAVRLTVAGLIPPRLAPEAKTMGSL